MQTLGRISIPNGTVGGGTTYSDAQVQALILSQSQEEAFAYDQLGYDYRWLSDLSPYVDEFNPPSMTHDSTAAVKRSLTIRLRGDAPFGPGDLLRPHYRLAAPDGGWLDWALGTFIHQAPVRNPTAAATWNDFNLPDLSQFLVDARFGSAFGVPAGADPVAAAAQIAQSYQGPTSIQALLASSGTPLAASLGWIAGTTLLSAINDLLASVVNFDAWFDELGRMRSSQIPDWSQVVPNFSFDTTVTPTLPVFPFQDSPDNGRIRNQYIVIVDDSRRPPPFSVTYDNVDPTSPVSQTTLKRVITEVVQDSSLPDRSTALRKAKALAQANSQLFSAFVVPTLGFPLSQDRDVFGLTYSNPDDGVVDPTYVEAGFTWDLHPGSLTQHTLARIYPS